jgi:uncharacterized protein
VPSICIFDDADRLAETQRLSSDCLGTRPLNLFLLLPSVVRYSPAQCEADRGGAFALSSRMTITDSISSALEKRFGRLYARQRLGIERDHEAQLFGQGLSLFHIENLPLSYFLIRSILMLTGLYWRGLANAAEVEIKHNFIKSSDIPKSFDGFTMLHLSDLHVDISMDAMERLTNILQELKYDICILTGDYRGRTFGPFEATLEGMARTRARLKGPIYGVMGNHDTLCMVPGLEEMGIRMLMNECETIERGNERINLAGVDDAHFYRMDNIEKVAEVMPLTAIQFCFRTLQKYTAKPRIRISSS